MMCPACSSSTRVLESRDAEAGTAVRRRRECRRCGRRFTTYERREQEPVHVRKRGGERERFDREKLRRALLRAAHKREVSRGDVDTLVARVEAAVAEAGGELPTERIGELCLEGLRDLDWGAYLQFAGTLEEASAHFAAAGGDHRPAGSVRVAREDPGSTPKAASRRRLDE